ncbi:lactate racemase domain-containing protein [Virgibacillus ndiopensis]|uniref:lactate racemase domain-containing protein n=1 Tax=Virgibacillus ndiopensis TaxID=2004408 RepID=UPI000C07472C|nr:lactate racemase domain-containing protein [Virgibacillus ndiopensis]
MYLYEIEQIFNGEKLNDLKNTIRIELQRNEKLNSLPKDAEVAITAGSRGIENIVTILKEVVSYLKEKGLKPFIVPAMGSHGGATSEGQVEILRHLGITEESVKAPIRSSMEVLKIGTTPDNLPVYMDKFAYQADAIIVINRIKVHTAFRGKVESGLSKMVTIGLGKQKGASFVHGQGANKMEHNIIEVSKYALEHAPICMGLAIVENGYDQTSVIKGINVESWHEQEANLLKHSKQLMPSIPIKDVDVLIVEEMGKCFSGTGMDPNIIGRWRIEGVPEPVEPNIKRIVVLDLADKSYGNAQGVGLADFTTEKLIEKIDRKSTYMNAITATYLQRAMFPLFYESEQKAIESALLSLGPEVDREEITLIQIANTLHLSRLYISKSVLDKLENNIDYKVIRKIKMDFEKEQLQYKISEN